MRKNSLAVVAVLVLLLVLGGAVVAFAAPADIVFSDDAVVQTGDTTTLTDTSTCLEPMAAPSIAEIILGAEGVSPMQKSGKNKVNLISLVARHMGPQTYFYSEEVGAEEGGYLVPKSIEDEVYGDVAKTSNPDYWDAVLYFLNDLKGEYPWLTFPDLTYSYDDYVGGQVSASYSSGTLLEEDFTGEALWTIPSGWSATSADNWKVTGMPVTGLTSPQICFCWKPVVEPMSRLISPVIDAGSCSTLQLTFDYYVATWAPNYTLKVQVSTDGGTTWDDTDWSLVNPATDVGPATATVDLSSCGGGEFQIAWSFFGNSSDIYNWYIDNINVTGN